MKKILFALIAFAAPCFGQGLDTSTIRRSNTNAPNLNITGTSTTCIKAGSDGLTLTADCSNKRVGINQTSPAGQLDIISNAGVYTQSSYVVKISSQNGTSVLFQLDGAAAAGIGIAPQSGYSLKTAGSIWDVGNLLVGGTTDLTAAQTQLFARTKAQIDALVPLGVGAVITCSNCTVPYVLCTATGTLAAQWVAMKTGNGCGSNN